MVTHAAAHLQNVLEIRLRGIRAAFRLRLRLRRGLRLLLRGRCAQRLRQLFPESGLGRLQMLRQLRLRDAVGARLLRLLVIVPEQRHARIQKLFKRSHRRARPTRLIVQLGTAGLDRFCDLRGRRGRRVALQEVKIAADAIHSEQEDERPVLDLVADLFLQVAHRVADRVDADDVFDAAKRLADPDLLTAERIDAVALIRPDLHLAPLQQEGAEHGRQHRGRAHFLRRLANEQQIFPRLIRDHDRPDVRHQPRRAERQDRLLPAVIILLCSKALRQRVGGNASYELPSTSTRCLST